MQAVYNFVGMTNVGLFVVGIALLGPFSVIPELMFELELSKNGTSKTALSDIVTSCVANLTLIIGLVALISPFNVVQGSLLNFNLFSLAAVFVLFNIYVFTGHKLDKKEGIAMLVLFFVYLVVNYLLIAV